MYIVPRLLAHGYTRSVQAGATETIDLPRRRGACYLSLVGLQPTGSVALSDAAQQASTAVTGAAWPPVPVVIGPDVRQIRVANPPASPVFTVYYSLYEVGDVEQ